LGVPSDVFVSVYPVQTVRCHIDKTEKYGN
jgi:hypothetical protein